jgi:transcriptional regulatory protein LevR
VHIQSAFSRLDEGLQFLMSKYEQELEKNNEEVIQIIEKRFAWTLRVVTGLVNLGYSPKKAEDGTIPGPGEYDVCIKIIEVIRLNVQLSIDQTRKMDEILELAILSFITTLRSNVLADPRVVNKVIEKDDDTGIYKADSYARIADKLSSKDILDIVEIFFKKMILNFFSDSEAIVEQNLEMLKTFVGSPGTQKFLLRLETTDDLLENHFTKYVFLNSESMYRHLSGFYKVLTMFWDVNDTIEKFYKYMKPCSDFIKNLLNQDSNTLVQSKSDVLRI